LILKAYLFFHALDDDFLGVFCCLLAEVGKVTLKNNGDEALNDEFLLKSNGDEALNDVFL
jgi:hypothetical protein